MSTRQRRLIAAGGISMGATLAMSGTAQAVCTCNVDSLLDPVDTGHTTLRDAITSANSNAGSTITFDSSLTGTIHLSSALPIITKATTITGPGAGQLTVSGDDSYRVLYIDPSTPGDAVSISGLTLAGGYDGTDQGGAIYNQDSDLTISNAVIADSYSAARGGGIYSREGSLDIENSTVTGNSAYAAGGVAAYSGDFTITDSTVEGNDAFGQGGPNYSFGYGGGIWIGNGADLTLDGSTVHDNTAASGGGVYAQDIGSNSASISNSTITGNHAIVSNGGGVWIAGQTGLTVNESTVTDNDAVTYGGGLQSYSTQSALIEDSIVSGNTAANNPSSGDLHEDTSVFDAYFSLIGIPSSYVYSTLPGSNLYSVDPKLGSLQGNGGPTQTMAPLCGSPVIDKGKAFDGGEDQRGLARPVELADYPNAAGGDGSDIGSVELQTSPGMVCTPPPPGGGTTAPVPAPKNKKCKKKHRRSAQSAKKRCKKKHK